MAEALRTAVAVAVHSVLGGNWRDVAVVALAREIPVCAVAVITTGHRGRIWVREPRKSSLWMIFLDRILKSLSNGGQ